MLKIQHLTKTYGDKKAVDDLSLHIQAGEIYGFIGHNGAGKTTTLKAAVGILPFDEGEITIGGLSMKRDPLICKRQMAYIPDNPDLYDFMTGRPAGPHPRLRGAVRADRRPGPAHCCLFPRHEAEAGYYRRLAAPAQTRYYG